MKNGADSSRTITVSNDVFFEQIISILDSGEDVIFTVKGFSMFPFLRNEKDNLALGRYDGSPLKKGQVILFNYRGKYILHRIVEVESFPDGKFRYTTLGDGNLRGCETASPDNIYGVMKKRITPSGKEWSCDSFSWKFLSFLWMKLRVVRRVPLAVLRRVFC